MDQIGSPVSIGLSLIENRFDNVAIAEPDGGAGCISGQLVHEVAGELAFLREQQLLEFQDIVKRLPGGELSAGVDRQALGELERLSA